MARILRSTLPDGFFHVTSRAVHETVLFRTDADRRLFLLLLETAARRSALAIHAYCLMGTHYHAILEGRTEDLSHALQWAHSHYAREYNASHERRGALVSERFAAWVIRDEEHYYAAVDYVLMNPVRAGLVRRASDWPWSGTPAQAPRLTTNSRPLDAERTGGEPPAAGDALDLPDPRAGDEAREPARADDEMCQVARSLQAGPHPRRAARRIEDRRTVPPERVRLPRQCDARARAALFVSPASRRGNPPQRTLVRSPSRG